MFIQAVTIFTSFMTHKPSIFIINIEVEISRISKMAKSAKDFDIVIYHGYCPDGIGAAWPFWRENRERVENDTFRLFGVKHNKPANFEPLKNKRVVLVDFCYKREDIVAISKLCVYMLILDHHASAERELNDLNLPNVSYIFDMKRSGAQIAWDWVYGNGTDRPWFIEIIADRDLWFPDWHIARSIWTRDESKAIGKALYIKKYYTWEKLEELRNGSPDSTPTINEFLIEGRSIIEREEVEIKNACKRAVKCQVYIMTEYTDTTVYTVKMTSCSARLRSEVGSRLAGDDCDFSATWMYDFPLDEWWISLRASDNSTIDLSAICAEFGGGGHPKASGFTIYGHASQKNKAICRGHIHDYFKIIREE